MAIEQEKAGRCGWVALTFVLFLLPGLLPGSFFGGWAGLRAADFLIAHPGSADLARRVLALLGMIIGLLTAAVIAMFITMAIAKFIRCRRQPQTCPDAPAAFRR